jgi:hypothetical protein
LELAIVGFGIVAARLMVDHALDPGSMPRSLCRREGYKRKAISRHLRVDRWVLPTVDGRRSGDMVQAGLAPVDDDRELFAVSQRRIESSDECPKRITRDDTQLICGLRGRCHVAAICFDWIATRQHISPCGRSVLRHS